LEDGAAGPNPSFYQRGQNPEASQRKTKIICTLGPIVDKTETRTRRFGIAKVLAD